jgi:hypothetical protein
VDITIKKLSGVRPSIFEGVYVSKYLGEIVTIRDVDAKVLFPPQLTSIEKRRRKYAVTRAAVQLDVDVMRTERKE